ncbi:MAG: tRNA1(Val) (adenine(37)-N6)-methyltransferase [Enterobacterales bacterium endosymbiont of Blomia tropicalis]|uniref:tRNA(1)(Val) (adenine(37)-N(6))-methyltransferase TrmN n=1 Tax=Mixta mediterraneensis TaxID=2758443 RepID=UPI0025A7A103|nr:tRNA1(Val) (adenine(37)-N6)-methyltransferase [Mixta mediterraneensis]MDL4912602.1 tRNA1(Val) (adenine(37)-N6)-methyltransferase [Mixta mediterraneensis]
MMQDKPHGRPQLKKNGFTFKQFFVAHDRCAMKVGTDGILLGAWAPVANVKRILDIGCGSGLIALMLAQRTAETVQIDAVELDAQAAQQAFENVQQSPWPTRIHIHQQDIATWAENNEQRYSLIVSNPPYFTPGVACSSPERDSARSTSTLDHQTLLSSAALLIEEEGFFCIALPETVGQAFIELALAAGWHLRFRFDVAEYANRLPHRVLLGFSPSAGETVLERLAIRAEDTRYSENWCSLTRDFYLFM